MPRRRTAGAAALLLLTTAAYAAGGGTGHATDGPGAVIEKVTVGPGAATTAAHELRPVPTVRFVVKPAEESLSISTVAIHFQRVGESTTVLDQGNLDCTGAGACTRFGDQIKVIRKLSVACADTAAMGRRPGEYRAVVSVVTSDGRATIARPSSAKLVVKRATKVAISVRPPQARKGETLRFSARLARYTVLAGKCNYAVFNWKGQPLQLWFDPQGSARARKVATARTGSDEFARFKPRNPGAGVWTVRYAGDKQHAPSVSAKRQITQRR